MQSPEDQQYRSWVEVNLDNFIANLKEVRRLIGPDIKILQVVKADAYGHGAIEISHVALKNGASCLGVANADEGIQLRAGGIDAPIVILSPSTASEIADIIKYNLTPSISDLSFARELQQKAGKTGMRVSVHVEVDTGMGRGGRMNHETLSLIQEIHQNFHNISIDGIFSHLSQSETINDFNTIQWSLFQNVLTQLDAMDLHIPFRHLANSGAILNYPDYHLDMVRPGLMTYGLYPSTETRDKARLVPVMSFKTRVILIKDFPKGYSIGYGRTFIADRPVKIATIPVGYGDGYGFFLSNQGEALIRGHRVPLVGRISMDMCTIDVSKIPECQIGDEVVLMGRQGTESITADDIAAQLHTIAYEIICALGKRAPRLFLQKGEQNAIEPRLRRIFIPDEERSLSRIDNIIRRCFQARASSAEIGDAVYYTMFEALFGKENRQLELRNNFKYTIAMRDFTPEALTQDPVLDGFYQVTIHVEYHKTLKKTEFFIGCAGDNKQLASLFDDENCEYRWLLNGDGDIAALRDFRIGYLRVDNQEIPIIKSEHTCRGYEHWFGGDIIADRIGREVKMEIELIAKRAKNHRDFSVYLVYPVRGLEIVFDYEGINLRNVREIAFFAGKHPSPAIIRSGNTVKLTISEAEWVFPTSGVTFIWDH